MSLFSFFKKGDKVGRDSVIDSNKFINEKKDLNTKIEVKTDLSYHPDWEIPKEQEYVFSFLAKNLKPLKPNQLSLAAINIKKNEKTGVWNIKAFFRSSLPKPIELGEIELILMDKDKECIGSKTFNFADLGVIPPNSARPWVFEFNKADLNPGAEVPKEGWTIAFNQISLRGHQLDLDETWKIQLPKDQQEQLAEIVKKLPKLNKSEVNLTSFQLHDNEVGSLNATIFIRNGSDKAINLEQLPLEIIEANGKRIAKSFFKLNPGITVQPNTTKPWTFIFPAEFVEMSDADLSRWTARVPQ